MRARVRTCARAQVAETHRVRDLAQMIADKTGTGIDFISNPRNEAAENELEVRNDKFGNLGVDFKSLDANLLEEVSFRSFVRSFVRLFVRLFIYY